MANAKIILTNIYGSDMDDEDEIGVDGDDDDDDEILLICPSLRFESCASWSGVRRFVTRVTIVRDIGADVIWVNCSCTSSTAADNFSGLNFSPKSKSWLLLLLDELLLLLVVIVTVLLSLSNLSEILFDSTLLLPSLLVLLLLIMVVIVVLSSELLLLSVGVIGKT